MKVVPEVARHANWLYWVAVLSVANIVLLYMGTDVGFAVSLGVSDILVYLGKETGGSFQTVSVMAGVVMAAIIWMLGWYACRAQMWAIIAGIVVLGLDTLLLLLGGVDAIISIAIHVWAIVSLFLALKAVKDGPVADAPPAV
jgi:hypothetical protein